MAKKKPETTGLAELRRLAEQKLAVETVQDSHLETSEIQELVHELRTHQIELEMQNEELRRAQIALTASRDQYTDLYDFSPVGYFTASDDGRILKGNLTLARMLAVPRSAIAGKFISSFVEPADQDILYRHLQAVEKTHRQQSCCLHMLRSGGPSLYVELESLPIKDETTGDVSLRTAVTDVTVRERQQALEQQMYQAQKLESLGLLAGGIAHDFNNLLMAIMGNASLALDIQPENEDVRQCITNIETTSQRAADLVNQMLTYSGKTPIVPETVNVRELVEEMIDLMRIAISKKAELRLQFDESDPYLTGCPSQIRQVAMNLIINASESLGGDEGVITVTVGATEFDGGGFAGMNDLPYASCRPPLANGTYAFIAVEDTGCGMDEEAINLIFDPFFTTKFMGRGLGMSAIHGIVKGHRGSVSVVSTVGIGSRLCVFFPLDENGRMAATETLTTESPHAHDTSQHTVLIVDDEPDVLSLGRRMTERLGYSVQIARDGPEALETVRDASVEVSCVVLDLTMPRMDGAETLAALREIQPGLPVIICSGYNEQTTVLRLGGTMPATFIQKPFDMDKLATVLARVLAPKD